MTDDLERCFHAETLHTYWAAKDECGYNATYFIQIVEKYGGVSAARRLLANNPSSGFTKLWELGRLDLSIEAKMLRPEFAGLFTEEELRKARKRLHDYGYKP
jgi:hypothetical protein